MMKKWISIALSAILLLPTLAACQSDSPQKTTTQTDPNAPSAPTEPLTPATELDLSPVEDIDTFQNPVLTSQDTGWNLGDPFAMRYNGSYYLYVTSPGKGVHCWKSDDLASWSYKGMCAKEQAADGAYAPEVFYYNGKFYMYASPNGNGHFVYSSDSPTGPFKAVTGNIGMSIDGSVFIDNNGKWYFYTAGGQCIQAYTMSSPTNMSPLSPLNITSMSNSWTEGPMVIYHDGYYYMTFTGNHFQSLTYRINYVYSLNSPTAFKAPRNQPVLINTSPEGHHLGHSSTVKGPDLDSYYIVYHSMKSNGYNRDVNIDRIVFNGSTMEVMGPTFSKQQTPDMPDLYNYFKSGASMDGWTLNGEVTTATKAGLTLTAGSSIVSNKRFTGNYTAEYNIANIPAGGMAGAIFSYTDSDNFGSIVFNPDTQKVIITITVNGESTVTEHKMIQSFKEKVKFDCIQSIQIEKEENTYTFYMNDREICKIKDSPLPGGSVGYIAQNQNATFGFIGATGAVGGDSNADDYKTVSKINGLIPATTYTTGKFPTIRKDTMTAVTAEAGNVLNYRILAAEKGNYDLAAEYFTGDKSFNATMEIFVDGQSVGVVALAGSRGLTTSVTRNIPLEKGQHTISFKITEGTAHFIRFNLLKNNEVKTLEVDYSANKDGNQYTDGSWSIADGVLSIKGNPSTGKRLYGDRNWGDYTVEVDVMPQRDVNAGLIVRATDPGSTVLTPSYSTGQPTDADAHASIDWVQGYYVGIVQNGILLSKLSYSYTQLERVGGSFSTNKTYHLKVVCEGANIKVYVDGQLYIDYTDANPFIQGMAGVRSYQSDTAFDNFKITAP